MSRDQTSVNLFCLGLCIILGKEYQDWIYQLPVYDDYTDPEYYHQN